MREANTLGGRVPVTSAIVGVHDEVVGEKRQTAL